MQGCLPGDNGSWICAGIEPLNVCMVGGSVVSGDMSWWECWQGKEMNGGGR